MRKVEFGFITHVQYYSCHCSRKSILGSNGPPKRVIPSLFQQKRDMGVKGAEVWDQQLYPPPHLHNDVDGNRRTICRDFECFYMRVLGRYESLRPLRNDDVMITL